MAQAFGQFSHFAGDGLQLAAAFASTQWPPCPRPGITGGSHTPRIRVGSAVASPLHATAARPWAAA